MAQENFSSLGKTLDIWSKWVDQSQVHVRIRKIGRREKLVVDLFEFSPEGVEIPREKLNQIATNGALHFGATSSDFCVIRDYLTNRKATRGDGSIVGLNIRQKSYVFQGFPEAEVTPA
jgi:hypothetical protein